LKKNIITISSLGPQMILIRDLNAISAPSFIHKLKMSTIISPYCRTNIATLANMFAGKASFWCDLLTL